MAIWADLVAENATVLVCAETIYTAVYNGVLEVKASECLRMRRPRRRRRQARKPSTRAGLPNIGARAASVNDRSGSGIGKAIWCATRRC